MKHFALPRSLVDREYFILEACKGKDVLHLGCVDFPFTASQIQSGYWLHSQITAVANQCVGVDLDAETIEVLRREHGVTNIVAGDAERLEKLDIGLFDVIVAGELIEHINNFGLFLSSAKSRMKPDGKLIISTPSAFALRRFVRIPFGKESVHPDHVCYFSHPTLENLVKRFGYKLVEAHSYKAPDRNILINSIFEKIATTITPNWGEGILHVYIKD